MDDSHNFEQNACRPDLNHAGRGEKVPPFGSSASFAKAAGSSTSIATRPTPRPLYLVADAEFLHAGPRITRLVGFLAVVVVLIASAATGQENKQEGKESVQLGTDMSVLTPALLSIGQETNYFLSVAIEAGFTARQTKALEDLYFEARVYDMRKAADLDVEEAELRRLLTRDEIDLEALLDRLKRVGAIEVDLKMHNIEWLLKAIQVLTHEQHLALVTKPIEAPALD